MSILTTPLDALLERRYITSINSTSKYTLLDWWNEYDEDGEVLTVLNIKTQYTYTELCNYIENKYPRVTFSYDEYNGMVMIDGYLKSI
jgi:hypothetical protein